MCLEPSSQWETSASRVAKRARTEARAGEKLASAGADGGAEDGVDKGGGVAEAAVLEERLNEAVVLRERAGRAQVGQLARGLGDERLGELERLHAGLVGNVLVAQRLRRVLADVHILISVP